MVLLKRAGPVADAVLRLSPERRRARDSPEARLRGARIAAHGLDGSAASRCGSARAPSRSCCRSASGSGGCWPSAQFRGKLLVEALVTVPLVLPPTVLGFYLLVTFGARSPLGQAFQAARRPVAAVLVRGAAARVRHRQHSVRRPADPARLRSDPGRRARCRRVLRPDAVAALPAHRGAARLAQHPDRRDPHLCAHARRVRRRPDGGRQPAGRDAHAERRDLRPHAGVRRSERRRDGGDAAGRSRWRR